MRKALDTFTRDLFEGTAWQQPTQPGQQNHQVDEAHPVDNKNPGSPNEPKKTER